MTNEPYLIGVTGLSGSGKSFFIRSLFAEFKEGQIALLSQDHYYKPIEQQPLDNNGIENFDTPQSIDLKHFEKDLRSLKEGRSIEKEEYNFNHRDLKPKLLKIDPAPVILAEGIFSFYGHSLFTLYDYKIFIKASEQVSLERRIQRDAIERGYDQSDVEYRYLNHVIPSFREFIEPLEKKADMVVQNNQSFEKELSLITSHIKSIL